MIYPFEEVVRQISKTDQQLQYYLILEQQETNRLLRQLIGEKSESIETSDPLVGMKRQDLMKIMAKLENKPQGWNTWNTEKMREHLKGAS